MSYKKCELCQDVYENVVTDVCPKSNCRGRLLGMFPADPPTQAALKQYGVDDRPAFSRVLSALPRDVTAVEVTDDLGGIWRIEKVGPVDGKGSVK